MATPRKPVMTATELNSFLETEFPQLNGRLHVDAVSPHAATVIMDVDDSNLRPGGTVSGPTMFTLADCAFYVATLAMIGPKALTVTTSCAINFMRKPNPTRLTAQARILKLGRALCVGDVLIFSDGVEEPVAQASLTYSIPPSN